MRLKKLVINYIKKTFSDTHSALVGVIVSALIVSGTGGLIYIFAENLWTQLKKAMQSATPLWLTTIPAVVVSGLIYTCRKIVRPSFEYEDYKIQWGCAVFPEDTDEESSSSSPPIEDEENWGTKDNKRL